MLEVLRRRLPGQRPAPPGCGGANATTVAWCGKLLEAQVVCVGMSVKIRCLIEATRDHWFVNGWPWESTFLTMHGMTMKPTIREHPAGSS